VREILRFQIRNLAVAWAGLGNRRSSVDQTLSGQMEVIGMSMQEEIRRLDRLIVEDWAAREDVVCRMTLRWAIGRGRYLRKQLL
jgi:hypothetical protein